MNIYVTHDEIVKAMQSIKDSNGEYLVINGRCILIDSILTIFPTGEKYHLYDNYMFSFSYNDTVISELIEINYTKEDSSCFSFLKKSELIDDHNLGLIYQKALDSIISAKGTDDVENDIKINEDKIDSIVYNEALIYLSNGINKGDKEFAQEDFKSKYETYKKTQEEETENTKKLLDQLYNMIVNIRCYGDFE